MIYEVKFTVVNPCAPFLLLLLMVSDVLKALHERTSLSWLSNTLRQFGIISRWLVIFQITCLIMWLMTSPGFGWWSKTRSFYKSVWPVVARLRQCTIQPSPCFMIEFNCFLSYYFWPSLQFDFKRHNKVNLLSSPLLKGFTHSLSNMHRRKGLSTSIRWEGTLGDLP